MSCTSMWHSDSAC